MKFPHLEFRSVNHLPPLIVHFREEMGSAQTLEIDCSWMRESVVDWIFQGPVCAVLIINLVFLVRIMWVLITKLRSANTVETRQYRKASKALLVLIPLLGITYLVVLAAPAEGVVSDIFAVARALLLSTQKPEEGLRVLPCDVPSGHKEGRKGKLAGNHEGVYTALDPSSYS
ncbi:diuretic hormone receptor [Culex quinquefasciatus]|uniref:Diuretic hormone receptor n=1 Tax=Culex quinquefasciatus TaxID=7176 RepID=B0WPS5_CULQU|nr:diuretic hormone receptor [Culex quinquefasciatus]|eukprot:XP_001850709.1 diuretic hormone receptor [Culex quinquefasciatus]